MFLFPLFPLGLGVFSVIQLLNGATPPALWAACAIVNLCFTLPIALRISGGR